MCARMKSQEINTLYNEITESSHIGLGYVQILMCCICRKKETQLEL